MWRRTCVGGRGRDELEARQVEFKITQEFTVVALELLAAYELSLLSDIGGVGVARRPGEASGCP